MIISRQTISAFRATCGLALTLVLALALGSCSSSVIPDAAKFERDAFLILPGLGYNRKGRASMRGFQAAADGRGVDVYVADFLRGDGLAESRAALADYMREHELERYRRLYIFAFIAGGYSLNPLLAEIEIPNLRGIVYDRSPTQERAPFVATKELGWIVRLGIGQLIFDIAAREYPVVPPERLKKLRVGILIETRRTWITRRYAQTADSRGPYDYDPAAFRTPHADFCYIPYNHDEVYVHFDRIGPRVLDFFQTGRFPDPCARRAPEKEPPAPE